MGKIRIVVRVGAGLAVLAAAAFAARVEIPAGTHILLRMVNSVSTRTAQAGDHVYLRTASPVSVNGRIVVPVNSYVEGVVTHAQRAGRVKGRARLGIRLQTLTLPRGKVLKFSPVLASADDSGTGQKVEKDENLIRQGTTRGRDAAQIAILAGSGAAIGAMRDKGAKGAGIGAGIGGAAGLATVLLTRGREVELRSGSSLDVVLDRPVALE